MKTRTTLEIRDEDEFRRWLRILRTVVLVTVLSIGFLIALMFVGAVLGRGLLEFFG